MSDAIEKPKPTSLRARAWRRLRGQAMVEYSIITHFILIGGTFTFLQTYVYFYESLSKFYKGVYFVLNNAAI